MMVPVATRESLDSRDIPQTPWPMVHPEPMRVAIIEGKLGIRAAGLFAEDKVNCVTTVSLGLGACDPFARLKSGSLTLVA